jgi:hypothetical protein
VKQGKTLLDGKPFLVRGLRLSNALVSQAATDELIANLALFADYGVNAISVFFQGSRFGDVKGYRDDASLDPVYAARMGQIIEAADQRAMTVLVGCLYWGNSRGKVDAWTQTEANRAIANTVQWLKDHNYRNVFVDVDNEGMALREKGFDNRQLVLAGKAIDPSIMIATNYKGDPPAEADLAIHHSNEAPGKPYIESEGSPHVAPAPGGYWGAYSKVEGFYGYVNVGVYTQAMKENQISITRAHLDHDKGYMLASTWLQAGPPQGPNHRPGGSGTPSDPGVLWWLEFLRDAYGRYQ